MTVAILEQGATFFPLPAGDKSPPPTGATGKGANVRLNAAARAALASAHPDANRGLLLGQHRVEMPDGAWRGIVVLDEDNKPERVSADGKVVKAQHGAETIRALETRLGPLPQTLTSKTPGYGLHRLFWIPDELANVPAKVLRRDVSLGDAVGVEVLTEGRYIVYPGSVLSEKKDYVPGKYEWLDPTAPIADLPRAWIDYIAAIAPPATEVQPQAHDVIDQIERVHRRELFVKECLSHPPSVQGQNGDGVLFEVVQIGAYDLALPTEPDVFDIVRDYFNPRCVPPWSESDLRERVRHKAHNAKTNSTRPRAEPLPAGFSFDPAPAPAQSGERLTSTAAPKRNALPTWGGWDKPVPPVNYIVAGLFPVETVGLFVAKGSSLKTWTAISVGMAVAQGMPWLGRYGTRKGRVLIADFESGLYELRRRGRILGGDGEIVTLGTWCYPDVRADQKEFWQIAAEELGNDGGLLIVDSLTEAAPGIDENDRNAALPLQLAARFTEDTHASVLVIHHSTKSTGGDARDAVRGSSAIYNACDWAYRFDEVEDTGERRRMVMSCIKPCMGPKPDPVPLELSDRGLYLFDEGDACKVRDTAGQQMPASSRILLAVSTAGSMAGAIEISKATRLPERVVREEIRALVERGELYRAHEKGRVYPGDPESQRSRACAAAAEAHAQGRPIRTGKALAQLAPCSKTVVDELIAEGVLYFNLADASIRNADGEISRQLFLRTP